MGFFVVGTSLGHVATLLSGGPAWLVGYLAFGGDGSILAVAGGSVACGLAFGIAFTRALGGPALNLGAILFWCWVGFGALVYLRLASPGRLGDFRFDMALLLPGILLYSLSGIIWARWLGIDRYNAWTRRTFPAAFFPHDSE